MLRVVIAEDEVLLALTLKAQLGSRGVAVVGVAHSGQQAVELCCTHHPDAVLMDVRMPGMDGIEATRQIMKECPAQVVVLSAWGDGETRARAEKAGAKAYLTKPASVDDVLQALGMTDNGDP